MFKIKILNVQAGVTRFRLFGETSLGETAVDLFAMRVAGGRYMVCNDERQMSPPVERAKIGETAVGIANRLIGMRFPADSHRLLLAAQTAA